MAGTSSPYFGKSVNTVEVAAQSVMRRYKTRKQTIKMEYETKHSALNVEENINCEEEEKKTELLKTNQNQCLGFTEANININIKKEPSENYDDYTSAQENNETITKANITQNIKNEPIVKSENNDNYTWAPNWVPKNWEILLHNIKEMRKHRTAVVDTLGCERLSDQWESPEVKRFQTLTSLLLSSQTKDQVTSAAVERLKKHGLNTPNIIKTSQYQIGKLIYPVGFWEKKAHYLKRCAVICQEKHHGDIPSTLKELMSLPGVGPKIAHICMNVAWGEVSGIGVDTHVHRISNRLGWVCKTTKVPDHTRIELESWLPRDEWKDINILLVGFGQEICKPVRPNCQSCLNKDICPSAGEISKNRKKRIEKHKIKKKMKVEAGE